MIIVYTWGRACYERAFVYGTGERLNYKKLDILPEARGLREKLLFVFVRRIPFEQRVQTGDFGDLFVVKRLVLLSLGRLGMLP